MNGPAGQRQESARHWRYEALAGLDLLRARYVSHTFPRHSHESYLLATVLRGVEDMRVQGGGFHVLPGSVMTLDPEEPHAARSGHPDGWAYIALYPQPDTVREIVAEISTLRGTPGFSSPVADDPYAARLLRGTYDAADAGNALAADILLRSAVTRLLTEHGTRLPARTPKAAGRRAAGRARALLEARMTEPPSLELLAREVGASPHALLRAFKAEYGMPPHTWLTDARVRRAQLLLAQGHPPAQVASAVGFTDQPHLNRHFTRIVGVPPGAYRKERAGPL
ncbi:AraC family transcriptional regulator [Streptomyces sp. NPDC047315]|uniref:AraC family transcriptional regulator n=1 Tax=Streptomyces sp. NPDC047315 TaxID=3155142 RepID=UPI0033C76C5F